MNSPFLRKGGGCDKMHAIYIRRGSAMTKTQDFLKSLPLFEKCGDEVIQRMALDLRWHSFKKGDTVLFQGMISHQMYFILSGRVAVFTRRDKETRRVASLGAGDYFGEISLLTNKAATATIKVEEDDTQIYILERDAVLAALSSHPEAMADVTRKVQERNQNRLGAFSQETAAVPVGAAA
jgi:CRP-like cAMP-binding protein